MITTKRDRLTPAEARALAQCAQRGDVCGSVWLTERAASGDIVTPMVLAAGVAGGAVLCLSYRLPWIVPCRALTQTEWADAERAQSAAESREQSLRETLIRQGWHKCGLDADDVRICWTNASPDPFVELPTRAQIRAGDAP